MTFLGLEVQRYKEEEGKRREPHSYLWDTDKSKVTGVGHLLGMRIWCRNIVFLDANVSLLSLNNYGVILWDSSNIFDCLTAHGACYMYIPSKLNLHQKTNIRIWCKFGLAYVFPHHDWSGETSIGSWLHNKSITILCTVAGLLATCREVLKNVMKVNG